MLPSNPIDSSPPRAQPAAAAPNHATAPGGDAAPITSRYVLLELPSDHRPVRVELGLNAVAADQTQHHRVSLPLSGNGKSIWRHAGKSGGDADVVALEISVVAVPREAQFSAFGVRCIQAQMQTIRLASRCCR